MAQRYKKSDQDIEIHEYHDRQNAIFIDEYEHELRYQDSSIDHFSDELKDVQQLAMNGIFRLNKMIC